MRRRHVFALPFLAITPAWAAAALADDWRRSVSELRLGTQGLARPLGLPVRLQRTGLADSLHRGQLEAARLDPASLAQARRLMGPRLAVHGQVGVLATLPAAMQADLAAALA